MPSQEMELIGDRALASLAKVDIEMRDGILAYLDVPLGAPGGGARRGRRRHRVFVGDLYEDRAANVLLPRDRPVGPLGEYRPSGDLVVPARPGDRPHPRLGLLAAHPGELPRATDRRDHHRLTPAKHPNGITKPDQSEPEQLADARVPPDLPQCAHPVEVSVLGDDGRDPGIRGRNVDDVTPRP